MGHLLMGLLVMFIMLALYAIIFAPSAREVAMGKPCVQALHAHYESNGVEEEQVIAGYDIAKDFGFDVDSPDKNTRMRADKCVLYAKALYLDETLPMVANEVWGRCGRIGAVNADSLFNLPCSFAPPATNRGTPMPILYLCVLARPV